MSAEFKSWRRTSDRGDETYDQIDLGAHDPGGDWIKIQMTHERIAVGSQTAGPRTMLVMHLTSDEAIAFAQHILECARHS